MFTGVIVATGHTVFTTIRFNPIGVLVVGAGHLIRIRPPIAYSLSGSVYLQLGRAGGAHLEPNAVQKHMPGRDPGHVVCIACNQPIATASRADIRP